jgi:CDP-glucose 4,6-dehydratase
LIIDSYMKSFRSDGIIIATARAGNVIGGGDWSLWRLVPDFYRSLRSKKAVQIRYPTATRPWQHVLDPLNGYLQLGRHLVELGQQFSGGWNFGPDHESVVSVMSVIDRLKKLNTGVEVHLNEMDSEPESIALALDSSQARSRLKWKPLLDLNESIEWTNSWMIGWDEGRCPVSLTLEQLVEYEKRRAI